MLCSLMGRSSSYLRSNKSKWLRLVINVGDLSNRDLKTMHSLCHQFTNHQLSATTTIRILKVETITRLDLAACRLYINKTTTTSIAIEAVNMLGVYTQTQMMMIR